MENIYDFNWCLLATDAMISIFKYLNSKDLESVCKVCRKWKDIAYLDLLWRRRFQLDFQIKSNLTLSEFSTSWINEYGRVTKTVPSVEFERIEAHSDEVLHISFSNNGTMFCSCSKDATIKVFYSQPPFNIILNRNLGFSSEHRWIYSQCSKFNLSDTLLLVSGRCPGTDCTGEILILDLQDNFTVRSVAKINYFDAMGTWLNETCYLSQHAYHNKQSPISIYMIKATDINQGMESTPCAFSCATCCYHTIADVTKYVARDQGDSCIWKIYADKQYTKHSEDTSLSKDELQKPNTENRILRRKTPKNYANTGNDNLNSYILLLCFTGHVMDFPHELGIKRIIHKPRAKLPVTKYFTRSCKPQRFPIAQAVRTKFEHFIAFDGIALGMAVSPCNRYVFVNVRNSLVDIDQVDSDSLQLASDVVLHQYDLLTLKEVKCFKGHKGLSNKTVSLLAVSCTDRYVTSGSEDNKGYMWDRHHGILLSIYSHDNIVNSVALNPCNSGMAVSCSDDHSIKIWHSKLHCKNYDKVIAAP